MKYIVKVEYIISLLILSTGIRTYKALALKWDL